MNKINFDHINYCTGDRQIQVNCHQIIDAQSEVFHFAGRKAKAIIEENRTVFSQHFNTLPSELYFSGNCLNQAIYLINFLLIFTEITDVFVSVFEAKEWTNYLKELEKSNKIKLHWIKTGNLGEINLSEFQKQLSLINKQALVSLSHANEYNGLLIPVKEVAKICQGQNKLFHLNLKSTVAKYKLDFEKLKPDFASIDLSEHCGGRDTGVFYTKQNVNISDKIFHQLKLNLQIIEHKDVYSICKLKESFIAAEKDLSENYKKIKALKNYFIQQFDQKLSLKHIGYSYHKEGIYSLISYFFPKENYGKYLAEKLDIEDILTTVIQYPVNKKEGSYIRFLLNSKNTKEEIDFLISKIKQI